MHARSAIKPALPIIAIALLMIYECHVSDTATTDQVNAILGNISYFERFGSHPDGTARDNDRVSTHLEYVERSLRSDMPADIGPEKRERREQLLDLLLRYRLAGIFPRNTVSQENRVPCFIDPDGRICAVGYLIEHTAGRDEAERINSLFQYERLLDMNDPQLDLWIEHSGFSAMELAMIQPQYGYQPRTQNFMTGLATSVLTVANLNMNISNAVQIAHNGLPEKNTHKAGFWTGSAQLLLGACMHMNSSESQRRFSIFNMAMGATTMATSYWTMQCSMHSSGNSWEPFVADHPMLEGSAFGIQFTRRF